MSCSSRCCAVDLPLIPLSAMSVLLKARGGGGVNGTFVVFAYLIIADGDKQEEKNRIKISLLRYRALNFEVYL